MKLGIVCKTLCPQPHACPSEKFSSRAITLTIFFFTSFKVNHVIKSSYQVSGLLLLYSLLHIMLTDGENGHVKSNMHPQLFQSWGHKKSPTSVLSLTTRQPGNAKPGTYAICQQ